ncbi:MAG: hypothetical protein PHN51_11610 [Candidatus Nanopelagicales bacterium]|nr:hypothetical protein [Candidatus Nanopelagicales bacterium]
MNPFHYHVRFVLALVFCLVLLVLQGCATTQPEQKVVYKTKTVYLAIPASFTEPIIPSKPRAPSEVKALSLPERELYLSTLVKDSWRDLDTCNKNLISIRKLQGTTKEAIDEAQSKSK